MPHAACAPHMSPGGADGGGSPPIPMGGGIKPGGGIPIGAGGPVRGRLLNPPATSPYPRSLKHRSTRGEIKHQPPKRGGLPSKKGEGGGGRKKGGHERAGGRAAKRATNATHTRARHPISPPSQSGADAPFPPPPPTRRTPDPPLSEGRRGEKPLRRAGAEMRFTTNALEGSERSAAGKTLHSRVDLQKNLEWRFTRIRNILCIASRLHHLPPPPPPPLRNQAPCTLAGPNPITGRLVSSLPKMISQLFMAPVGIFLVLVSGARTS